MRVADVVIFLLLVQAIRHLRTIRLGGRPIGLALSWAVIYSSQSMLVSLCRAIICRPIECDCKATSAAQPSGKNFQRLRQAPDHGALRKKSQFSGRVVYNGAEIDTASSLGPRTRSSSRMQSSSLISRIARSGSSIRISINMELDSYPTATDNRLLGSRALNPAQCVSLERVCTMSPVTRAHRASTSEFKIISGHKSP